MGLLIRFEMRKIVKSITFYVAFAMIAVMIFLLVNMRVSGAYITDKSGNELKGRSTITLRKEYDRKLAGPLNTKKMSSAIERHKKVISNPKNVDEKGMFTNKAYGEYEVPDEQINSLIRYMYSPSGSFDYYVLDTLQPKDTESFYQKRMEKINGFLNYEYSYGNYTAGEKAYFNQMNEKLPVPFQMDYVGGWEQLVKNMPGLFMGIALAIAICLAQVFAGEYQKGTDAVILTTRYGRSKIIISKLLAGFIVSCIIIVVTLSIHMLVMLGIFGYEGGNASVQIINMLAPVPYTVLQAYLWAALIGGLACLMVAALTMCISSWMRSPYPVIIMMSLLLVGPFFIPASKSSRLFNYLMNLWPCNMFDAFNSMASYELFHLFGQYVPTYKVMAGFAIVFIILTLPLTYRAFSKHQVV